MKLNEIRDREGAFSSRKRLGKGQGSGTGKTAGRGMKGQKSRSGSSIKGFEGGQMPLYRRVPKRGFNDTFRTLWQEVNVGRIEKFIELGKLDGSSDIDATALCAAGLIRRTKDRIKLLGKGELKVKKLHIVVDAYSSGAKESVEAAGGRVTIRDRQAVLKEEFEEKKALKRGVSEKAGDLEESTKEAVKEKKVAAKKAPAKESPVKKAAAKKAPVKKTATAKKTATKKAPVKKDSEEGGSDEKV